MGKHKAITARKWAAAVEDPGSGQGCTGRKGRGKKIISGFYMFRVFCALSPPGEEKIVQLHKPKWKNVVGGSECPGRRCGGGRCWIKKQVSHRRAGIHLGMSEVYFNHPYAVKPWSGRGHLIWVILFFFFPPLHALLDSGSAHWIRSRN